MTGLREWLENILVRHDLVIWRDSWNCRCGQWGLNSRLNNQDQMNKSWREHFLEVVDREAALEASSAGGALRMGDGDYSCATCGMGMKEPCEHWRAALAQGSAGARDFDLAAISEQMDRILAGQRELTVEEQKNLRGIYAKLFKKVGVAAARGDGSGREALESIVNRFEREDTGGLSTRDGLAWAMYSDAKRALAEARGDGSRRAALEARLDEHKLISHEKCSDQNPCTRRKWLQRALAAAHPSQEGGAAKENRTFLERGKMAAVVQDSGSHPKPPEFKGLWFSICSLHGQYEAICGNCNTGHWVSDEEQEFSHWLWKYSPEAWRKWANRAKENK